MMSGRKSDASIAFSVTDNLSQSIVGMKNSVNSFRADVTGLQASLDKLDSTRFQLKNFDLKNAKRELERTKQAFEELGEAATDAEREAAKADFQKANQNYENVRRQLDLVSKQARQVEKDMLDASSAISKADNRAGAGGGADGSGASMLAALGKAGLGQMAGDAAQEVANTLIGSAFGDTAGGVLSSGLSGAISGAAIGSIIPGIGTAVGAAIGGGLGLLTGGTQAFETKDEAFKGYVQEAAEGQFSAQEEAVASGSSIAGGREQKQMAFATLLGSEEEAAAFLADVQEMAAMTNYTYDEITGYAKSLVKPFGEDKSLDILTTLSDASAALSLNESDNAVLIAGLSRMKLTDKTTQEYLNYFSERGIDVYEALSKWGNAAAVAEKVTRGEIRGSEAVEEILSYMQEQYGGLSEQMAGTYEGMVDNLADAEANAEAAYGEGYNEKRKEGIQAQMDWLNSGVMDEANRAIGAWQAELENTKEQYQREAVEAMMETDEYQQAQAEGDAAEMGRLIMQAKVQGMNEYNASEGAQLALESELALAAAIRDDASSNQAYWDAGYRKSQEYSKGLAAGMASALVGTGSETTTGLSVEERRYGNWRRGGYYDEDGVWRSHAAGLERVPYDGYAALLHEGERVLTAREARQADQGGGAQVTITGNTFQVRQESDIDAIAEALYRKLRLAQMGGVR